MELDHAEISLDETLGVLADHRRRTVLRFLSEQPDNTASLSRLIEALTAREQAVEGRRSFSPERLETRLLHVHLPKLEDEGLVEYDDRSGRVRYDSDETLEELLDFISDF